MGASWLTMTQPDLTRAPVAQLEDYVLEGTRALRAERAYRDEMPTVQQEVRVALAKRETALMYQRWANEAQRQGKPLIEAKYRDKEHSTWTLARSHMKAAHIRKEADE